MKILLLFLVAVLLVLSVSTQFSFAQGSLAVASATPTPSPTPLKKVGFAKDIAHDQKAIWESPFHVKRSDLKWLVPLAATTVALIATDKHTSAWVDQNGSLPGASRNVSSAGSVYGTGGVAVGLYLLGQASHNTRARETGLLATEALIDTGIVTEVLKLSAQRMRPDAGSGQGLFFKKGSSFPSGHSSSTWAVATVIAYKYKNRPLVKYGAIAAAIAVSASRYSGRNHFLSDILVGSAIGFGTARFVTLRH